MVFRKLFNSIPETIYNSPLGDFFLWLLISENGGIKRLDEVMAVYRSGIGIHSSKDEKTRNNSFRLTLDLLSDTIEDPTVVAILRYRSLALKSANLPAPIRALKDFSYSDKASVLKDFVSFDQLLKALWLKLKRKF